MHGELWTFSTEHLPGNMEKGDATNFGKETPSKRRKTSSSVPSASPSMSTSLSAPFTDIAS